MTASLVSDGSINSPFSSPNKNTKSNVSSTPSSIVIVISEELQIYEENNSCNFSSCSLGIYEFKTSHTIGFIIINKRKFKIRKKYRYWKLAKKEI